MEKNKIYSWSKNGMKMIIDTGYKTFDKQVIALSSGNVISSTQYSNYIRPYNEVINPVGDKVKEGELRNYDLKYFERYSMRNNFKDWLYKITEKEKVILYEYFICKDNQKEVIGWLVQNADTKKIIGREQCIYSSIRKENKTKVLDFCQKFLESEVR